MKTTRQPLKLGLEKYMVMWKLSCINWRWRSGPYFENPKALKAKDCLPHVLCCTDFMLVCPVAQYDDKKHRQRKC